MEAPNEQEPKPSVWDKQLSERGIGVLALVCCGVLAYLSIISPLIAASRHEERVSFSLKGAVVTPVLLTIGVIYVLMGDRTAQILGKREKPSALGWVIYIATFVLGILLYQWLKSTLRGYGYGA
jgi:threonine/homoserine/homoserine lactone efflux protein